MTLTPAKKITVGVLGATGSVGQKFVQLLADHPWFEIASLAASGRSAGMPYQEAVAWLGPSAMPEGMARMNVQACEPDLPCRLVFSALDAGVAGEVEQKFARAGYIVVSNARNHRLDPDVPLLVPEVNSDHLAMVEHQRFGGGMIITNPNCSTIGLVIALKPLADAFGIRGVSVVTLQALSGAGYPGVPSLDILDNVIPFIRDEEEKMQAEPLKILGDYSNGSVTNADLRVSAQCNRVGVADGHLECISVKLANGASRQDLRDAWQHFRGEPQRLKLPMAPLKPIYYLEGESFPQPRLHRNLDKGMAVSIGRLRECTVFDYKFVAVSHNTVRGAAGGAILCAELLVQKGYTD